jgi:hypothetical protein
VGFGGGGLAGVDRDDDLKRLVDDPTKFDDRDNTVVALVDTFLRDRDLNPISTVTNTLFPDSLYRKYGSPRFYDEYHTQVYDKLTSSKQWGRYFERLTRHQDGEGGTYNPLQPTFRRRSNYFFSHGQSGINGILFTAN